MFEHKVKIYPPKTPSVVSPTSVFPITNVFDGSVVQAASNINYSFIYPTSFGSAKKQNCAWWYCPVDNLVLRNVTFQYEVISNLGTADLEIYVNNLPVATTSLISTIGVQNVSFDNMTNYLFFGDSVFMKVIITSGSYIVYSTTAIFELL